MQIKFRLVCTGLVVFMMLAVIVSFAPVTTYAESVGSENLYTTTNEDGVAEPYALYVDVGLGLNGGDGEVWAIAKTKVAIFASSIQVVVELYSSDTYQDSYQNMTLVNKQFIANLKQGESIKAAAPTNGEQKYWRGRCYYKVDSAAWKYGETETLLLDANGIIVL